MPVYFLDEKIRFPNPKQADPNGLIAVGGDLSSERLLFAYKKGIFPWYSEGQPILWFSPDPRLVFYPKDFKRSKSLDKLVNSGKFEVKVDTNFVEVIENCAKVERKFQSGTWITEDMIAAYINLHNLGYAHSFETYLDDKLVGGLYGVSMGGAFFGESMFYTESEASKVAFYYLVEFSIESDFDFIDSQVPNDHMLSMGGVEISRDKFLKMLDKSLDKNTMKGKWKLDNPRNFDKNYLNSSDA